MGISLRAYAKLRGVSDGAVRKAIKTGRIKTESDGTIDPAKADIAWNKNTNPAQQRQQIAPEKQVETTTIPPTPPQPDTEKRTSAVPAYQTSRAVRETYAAKMAKLDFEERTKGLVKADEVKVAAFNSARQVRDRLFCIPPRLAAVLAAEDNAHTIEQLLQKELRDALEALNP